MKKNVLVKLRIQTEQAMGALGLKLAKSCRNQGAIIFLYGQLGAGKTTCARGILQGLGYLGPVKSPTYTLVEPYHVNKRTIYHFDFYRIKDPEELEYIGIRDYFSSEAICLVEWPEQGGALLPKADLSCYFELNADERNVKLVPNSRRGEAILERFEKNE